MVQSSLQFCWENTIQTTHKTVPRLPCSFGDLFIVQESTLKISSVSMCYIPAAI